MAAVGIWVENGLSTLGYSVVIGAALSFPAKAQTLPGGVFDAINLEGISCAMPLSELQEHFPQGERAWAMPGYDLTAPTSFLSIENHIIAGHPYDASFELLGDRLVGIKLGWSVTPERPLDQVYQVLQSLYGPEHASSQTDETTTYTWQLPTLQVHLSSAEALLSPQTLIGSIHYRCAGDAFHIDQLRDRSSSPSE